MPQIRLGQFWTIICVVLSGAVWNTPISTASEGVTPPKTESKTTDPQPFPSVGPRRRSNAQEKIGKLKQQIFLFSKAGDFKSELVARKALVSLMRSEYGVRHWTALQQSCYLKSTQRTCQLDAEKQKRIAHARILCVETKALREAGLDQSALSRAKESLEIYRSVIGEADLLFVDILMQVGYLQNSLQRYNDSHDCYSKALALRLQLVGERTPTDAHLMNNLANVHIKLKNLGKAEKLLVHSAAILRLERAGSSLHGVAQLQLAQVYNLKKNFSEARSAATEASRILEKLLPQQYPYFIKSRVELARSYMGHKQHAEAVAVYEQIVRVVRSFKKKHQPPAQMRIELFEHYASALQANGNKGAAEDYQARAAKLRRQALNAPQ